MEIFIDASVERVLEKLRESPKTEDRRLVAEIFHVIDMLRQHGIKLSMPYSRVVKGYQYKGYKLRELRVSAHVEYRIFYVIKGNRICILLSTAVKKSWRLSKSVYENAFRKMKSYIDSGIFDQ